MAQNGFRHVLARHAAAVIGDAHKRGAAVLDFDGDGSCAGVGTVFEHFLDGGCRAFDHFTGGDEVGGMLVEYVDDSHKNTSFPGRTVFWLRDLEFQADISGFDRMCERTDGNDVHAGLGDLAKALFAHVAAGFDECASGDNTDAFAHEVV